MTDRALRMFFAILAGAMVLSLIAGATWRAEPKRPTDAKELAAWMESHPADWEGAAALTEAAPDSDLPRRFELWQAAHEDALTLAPLRDSSKASFIRSGFFHWYELDDAQKHAVLREVAPMLRDEQYFRGLAPAIWRLTHDLAFLKEAAGNNYTSTALLRDIAATNGLFADYRDLRDEALRQRTAALVARMRDDATLDPTEFVPVVCTTEDQPLLQAILEYAHDHPIDKHPADSDAAQSLIDFAIRHRLQPLDGIEFLAHDATAVTPPFRARLAIAIGDQKRADLIETGAGADDAPQWSDYYTERAAYELAHGNRDVASAYAHRANVSRKQRLEWSGRCSDAICTSARKDIEIDNGGKSYSLSLTAVASDDVAPYVEIYVDEARVAEGTVGTEETFSTPTLSAGVHRVLVRVVNPFTRNLAARKVKVLRESLL